MQTALDSQRPITLLICALGGEGGGVLAEWLVETAVRCGHSAQSTSIPGVAQRTGATTYYLEVFPVPDAALDGRKPVFSLSPVPGALDALVSSELLETVRQIGSGMVSPERTLVVTSQHRTLTTSEKMQPADGRASASELLEVVQRFSRAARVFDMAAVAQQTGTVLSAVLFGAIAGSGILPFAREACEQTIRRSGKGVEASLRGFAAACEAVVKAATQPSAPAGAAARAADSALLPAQIAESFPAATHDLLGAGYARMLEYQDAAYAKLYVGRLARVLAAERAADRQGERGWAITRETARYLALWMAFDDIVRVADLKCRASRFARVRREVKAAPEELVRVFDHFKPGVPELAALLPQGMARALLDWDKHRQQAGKPALALPLKLGAHTVSGLLALRLLAGLKWLRRRGSRFAAEQALIERWLAGVEEGTREHWPLGHEIALCGRLIKGYGSTNERGKDNLLHVLDHLAMRRDGADGASRAQAVRAARLAALADDGGKALDQALVEHGAPARPLKAQPVRWVKKPRAAA
jgi:indolepyruvate ferredoxin oxidoreductase, beta subunit